MGISICWRKTPETSQPTLQGPLCAAQVLAISTRADGGIVRDAVRCQRLASCCWWNGRPGNVGNKTRTAGLVVMQSLCLFQSTAHMDLQAVGLDTAFRFLYDSFTKQRYFFACLFCETSNFGGKINKSIPTHRISKSYAAFPSDPHTSHVLLEQLYGFDPTTGLWSAMLSGCRYFWLRGTDLSQ